MASSWLALAVALAPAVAPVCTDGPRMGPPPPGYVRITGEPVPGWTPADAVSERVSALAWQPLGPRPILDEYWSGNDDASGRVVSIAPHPTDPATVYAAAASGGVWKTTDGGALWLPISDELPILNHGCVTLDPTDPQRVYVGTGEYPTQSRGAGIFRSPDGGVTWEQLATDVQVGTTCSRLIVDPANPAILHHAGAAGYFRSLDAGATWTELSPDARPSSGLVVHPSSPNVLYLAQHGSGDVGGIYRSDDGGTSWTELTVGLPVSGFQRVVLALAPSAPDTVYAVYTVGSDILGLWKTVDGGASWIQIAAPPVFDWGQAWYDTFVAVDPENADIVYAGGVSPRYSNVGVIKSTDGGATWTEISCSDNGCNVTPDLHPDMHTMAFGADGTLWVGNDGGIWKSTDGGAVWVNTNATLTVTQNYAIALHPTDPAQLMGGTQDNGTVGRDLGTDEWPQVLGGDGGFLAYDFLTPGRRYTTYVYLTVYRFPGGAQITGPWSGDPKNFIAPLVMDPNDPFTLLGGTNRVWRTRDAHTLHQWTPISTAGNGNLNAIAVAPGASDTIYTGSTSGQLRVTTDAALWTDVTAGLPGGQVSDILIHPGDPALAYVSFYNTSGPRILRTASLGAEWEDVTGTLPAGVSARALAIDWRLSPPTLYVGSGAGVWWSEDLGATWQKDGADLPNVHIGDLAIDFVSERIYAGTYGRGAWVGQLEPALFRDGFESGDTSRWSATIP